MKILASFAACLLLAGCTVHTDRSSMSGTPIAFVTYAETVPVCNLPAGARVHNYAGGSCYHASFANGLRWENLFALGDKYKSSNRGGAGTTTIAHGADRLGVQYDYTTRGDVAFLEHCLRTRRMPAITYKPGHAINLVHLDAKVAIVLDNNHPRSYDKPIPREEFIRKWKGYGGGAIAPIYSPLAPVPRG